MSQFVFPRRYIQNWLNHLSDYISQEDAQHLADRLNSVDRLSAMWEVALLYKICEENDFQYEMPLPNGKAPDFKFTVTKAINKPIEVFGDVTTLSDEGIDKQNPIEFFMEEMFRQQKTADLFDMPIRWKIGHHTKEEGLRAKKILSLPPKGEIPKVIKRHVIPVLRSWKVNNIRGETVQIETDGLSMSLTSVPNGHYSGGGYAGYQNVGKIEDSPLHKKLKDKKSQFSAVPDDAISILIICDADSHVIKPSLLYSPFTVDAGEICQTFINKSNAYDLIVLVAIETKPPRPFDIGFDKRLSAKIFVAQRDKRKSFLTDDLVNVIHQKLSVWLSKLPTPLLSPENAKRRLRNEFGPTPYGGFTMSENTIELSSRRITELLGGIVTTNDWKNDFKGSQPNPIAFFIQKRMEGRMIQSIVVKRQESSDDDLLVITYGEPDAAISKFTVPD